MRNFTTITAVLATIIFLAAGHFYWEKKTTNHSAVAKSEKKVAVKDEKKEAEPAAADFSLLAYASNLPGAAQNGFEAAILDERPYKIALVGSEALGEEDGGWSVKLRDALADTYGDAVEVEIFEYGMRSDQFLLDGHDEEVAEFKPDFVLFEPFTLKDNGEIEVEVNHENIKMFIEELEKSNERVVVVLQPPHPIHDATYYPGQVEDLKKFAEKEKIDYLDHWSEWPDQEDEKLRSYLLEDQSAPNKKGHEVWFEYLKEFFIAE